MEEKIKNALEVFGFPFMRQGSLSPTEAYPDHFFTYWTDDTAGTGFYDNDETCVIWSYSLNFYSINPELVNDMFKIIKGKDTAKSLLRKAGFIVAGAGYDVASDEPTHTGRGMTVLYREKL